MRSQKSVLLELGGKLFKKEDVKFEYSVLF
jgi:hypothetical protein